MTNQSAVFSFSEFPVNQIDEYRNCSTRKFTYTAFRVEGGEYPMKRSEGVLGQSHELTKKGQVPIIVLPKA